MRQFNAEVSRVLHLVIHSLYTDKDIFLRELVSNASDACEKLRYLSIQDVSLVSDNYVPKIQVLLKKEEHKIIVRDNGIGMDENDLIKNLGTIAQSGTRDFSAVMNKDSEKNIGNINDLIGQFGVGFYSSFMVADKVEVRSKKAGKDQKTYLWVSDGISGFEIEECNDLDNMPFGTEITLFIKENVQYRYSDAFQIENIITTYSNHISFPIEFQSESDVVKEINPEKALWLRDKNDITEEQYKDFYRSLSHLPGDYFSVLHNKVDGRMQFTNLIFIPGTKPFDIYHPDRLTKVKLYVKHVFINETVQLLPRYLRFVYGVIDVDDLPLNVSRQTLQDNDIVHKIKDIITKKVFTELKNHTEDSRRYDEFWNNFGAILKEGLCESTNDRESLLSLIRFYTSKSLNKLMNLEEYVANMKEDQKEIYYIINDLKGDIVNLPEMEVFLKNDIEVIVFSDPVDSFWLNLVHDYQGKDLKNIARADIDLSAFKKEEEKKEDDDQKTEQTEMTNLLMKNLEGKVAAVKITTKLTDSPACLSINPGGMDFKMEKLLYSEKQLNKKSLKILEVNPHHDMIIKVCKGLESTDENLVNEAKEMLSLLLDILFVGHGEEIKDTGIFIKKLLKRITV